MSTATRGVENTEQAARKELGRYRTRRTPLERDQRISKATREIENKEQAAGNELESFRTRSKPPERD